MKNLKFLLLACCLFLLQVGSPDPATGATELVTLPGTGDTLATPYPPEILAVASSIFLPLVFKEAGPPSSAMLSVLINHFLLFVPSPAL